MAALADVLRGQVPTIILSRLVGEDSYGYRINRDIQQKVNGRYELKEATLYSAFRRLEKEGLISSYWGDEEAGARRRYYTITDKGRAALEENRQEWQALKVLIDEMVAPAAQPPPGEGPAPDESAQKDKSEKKRRGIFG